MMSHSRSTGLFKMRRIITPLIALAFPLFTVAAARNHQQPPTQLGVCETMALPAASTLVFHAYATGVQIYRWNGTSWVFVAPAAALYEDAGYKGAVGIHYAGPRWESISGSIVRGSVVDRCTADATAIQWLSLSATPESGSGVFQDVNFIQRVNTVGGLAPSYAGTKVDETAKVPYTAEYLFYR